MGERWADVTAAREGDIRAYGALVERYHRPICAFAATIVRDYHGAQDVAQAAFIQAYDRIHELRDAGSFATWLFRIAYRAALDHTRRSDRSEALVEAAAERTRERPDPPDEPVVDGASQRELRGILDHAMQCLTPEQGAVLALRYWQEMSCREIAEVLDVRVETVRVRLLRARRGMRNALGNRLAREGWGNS